MFISDSECALSRSVWGPIGYATAVAYAGAMYELYQGVRGLGREPNKTTIEHEVICMPTRPGCVLDAWAADGPWAVNPSYRQRSTQGVAAIASGWRLA